MAGTPSRPASRWDEIRAANARGSRPSSWDALRQQRERGENPDYVQQPVAPTGPTDADAERAREQARFDAMLEAERRLSQA